MLINKKPHSHRGDEGLVRRSADISHLSRVVNGAMHTSAKAVLREHSSYIPGTN